MGEAKSNMICDRPQSYELLNPSDKKVKKCEKKKIIPNIKFKMYAFSISNIGMVTKMCVACKSCQILAHLLFGLGRTQPSGL